MSVERALKEKKVSVSITGKGGYTGKVISMTVNNISGQPLDLFVECGRRLDSFDTLIQDILVTGDAEFAVNTNAAKTVDLCGMCCQASNRSPSKTSKFSIGNMADTLLVKLARYIQSRKLFEDYEAQHAVWVISDKHSMASIGDAPMDLQGYVSKLTGRPIAQYAVEYENGSDDRVFSGRIKKISAAFEYQFYSHGTATLGVYDSKGRLVNIFFNDMPHDKGVYKWNLDLPASQLPRGKYYARLWADGQKLKEMEIEI